MRISDWSSDVCSSDLDRQAARLVDEVDGAPFQGRLLVDLVAQHGEEDHRGLDAALAHAAQHGTAVEAPHAPVQHDVFRLLAGHHYFERALAVGQTDNLVTLSTEFGPPPSTAPAT